MRQKAIIPVAVPPVQPAGIFHDYPPANAKMRFEHATKPVRPGARVRIWGGYEAQPAWLAHSGERSGVLGTVLRYLTIPGALSKEAVIHLDRPLINQGTIGEFLVLRLQSPLAHWTSGETVSVELCEYEPNTRFMRRRIHGTTIESAAICELL